MLEPNDQGSLSPKTESQVASPPPPPPPDRQTQSGGKKKRRRGRRRITLDEYPCCFCSEYGIGTAFSRRNDLKRHIEVRHHINHLWSCTDPDCAKVFQSLGSYRSHLKICEHKTRVKISQSPLATLCPQTVFACGYDNCTEVFEASDEMGIAAALKDYTCHIVDHLRYWEMSRSWSYTTKIRNLLRQRDLANVWPPPGLTSEEALELNWDPQSGAALQKQLETRHFGDPAALVKNAIALGSNGDKHVPSAGEHFVMPILRQCLAGRQTRGQYLAPAHMSQSSMATSNIVPSEISQPTTLTMGSNQADYQASMVDPNYIHMVNGGYPVQPQAWGYPGAMPMMPENQQFFVTNYALPMDWVPLESLVDDSFLQPNMQPRPFP